jgi:hypothetical protein
MINFFKNKKSAKKYMPTKIKCEKCKNRMEFYGVDGYGGLKFICPKCYDKIVVKN